MRHRNPPKEWIYNTLAQQREWDAMASAVEPSLMPKRPLERLGTGGYGSVYETKTPGVVVKVTHDPEEVAFIFAAMQIGQWPEGITRYQAVHRLRRPYEHEDDDGRVTELPVYALWREAAADPMTGPDFPWDEIAWSVELAYALRYSIQGMTRAEREATLRLAHGPKVIALAEDWSFGPPINLPEGKETIQDTGAMALALKLRWDGLPPPLKPIAQALTFYLDRGILITDAHEDNFGVVTRNGRKVWTIRDPGIATFLTAAYDDVIDPVEALVSNPEGELKTLRTMVKRLQKVKPAPKPVQVIERRFDKPPGADAALFEKDDGFLILVQPGLPLPRLEERLIHEWAHLHDQCGKRPCGHNRNWGGNYADTYRRYHRTKNSRDQRATKRARNAAGLKRRLLR